MPESLRRITDFLMTFAPLDLAESWDNVGLLLGDETSDVHRVMTCLTLTPDVAEEAIQRHAELIVSHHPILFRPVQRLTSSTSEGRMLLALLRAGIAVYSPHTAFDSAELGINQLLAERLGLRGIQPLRIAEPPLSPTSGTGRCGELSGPMTLREFLELVKQKLSSESSQPQTSAAKLHLQYTGDLESSVTRVGIGCGSAAEFLRDAVRAKCDVFMTGEARFHSSLEARDLGIGLVLAGHYWTERHGVERLAERLQLEFPSLECWSSERETDPVLWSVE